MFPQENIARSQWVFLLMCYSAFIVSTHGSCGMPWRFNYAIVDAQFIDHEKFPVGAQVTYNCLPGYILVTGRKNVISCLINSTWSTPETFCQLRTCGIPTDIQNGEMQLDNTYFGSRANYTCDTGYKMISKKNYRDCLADGTWSNEAPVCEVQICMPPYPITDGSFHPNEEEYTYQQAVKYQCNSNKFALIGESAMFCTVYGNWSSDAPKCVAVECPHPNVANAVKSPGTNGPYYFNFALRFECAKDYTMNGADFVMCNASSQWDPPLPTCSRNNVAAGNCVVILTAFLMRHLISHYINEL